MLSILGMPSSSPPPTEESEPGREAEGCRGPLSSSRPLLEVRDLVVRFHVRHGLLRRQVAAIQAVDGVSLEVARGETLGLVGESGCGKTTLARAILRLVETTSGDVLLDGESLVAVAPGRLRALRRRLQLVFQDSTSALNPRRTVESTVGEGLLLAGVRRRRERRAIVSDLLTRVGLDPARHLSAYPHELSGGQRQRVGIARALVVRPWLVICDEAVSSLDVSVEAQILNLLRQLQAEDGHGYLFISHDLSVVRYLSDRVAVMYLGRIVETGPAGALYEAPHHPYTRALLDAAPSASARGPSASARGRRERIVLPGEPPSPIDPPRGCRFHPRCPKVMDRCRMEDPPAVAVGPGHASWCFLPR